MFLKFVVSKDGPKVLFPWDYIGKGTEGKVYRKNDFAYKYYHSILIVAAYHWRKLSF